jgi:signal peptidase I
MWYDGQSTQIIMTGADGNNFGPVIVPSRGDTIFFAAGHAQSWKEFIAREHHSVQAGSDGSLIIDGVERDHYQVECDYYFMLGDNRGNSLDSRFWGFVPEEHIVGEALMLYWSWDPDHASDGVGGKLASIRWGRIGALVR